MDTTFCEKDKFSDTQVFLQRIFKGVIKCVLVGAICNFHASHKILSLYSFPSTASVCLTSVIKCEIHFQLDIALMTQSHAVPKIFHHYCINA